MLARIEVYKQAGLKRIVYNADNCIGVLWGMGVWFSSSEPALVWRLTVVFERLYSAGIDLLLHWTRSHSEDITGSEICRVANARADQLARLGRDRTYPRIMQGILEFRLNEHPAGPASSGTHYVSGVQRVPEAVLQAMFEAQGEGVMEEGGTCMDEDPEEEDDQNLLGEPAEAQDELETKVETALLRRELKMYRVQRTVYYLLRGQRWATGEPIKAMQRKLGRIGPALGTMQTVHNLRRSNTILLRKRLPPRVIWARVMFMWNMVSTSRKMTGAARSAHERRNIKKKKWVESLREAGRARPYRLRLRKKGAPVLRFGFLRTRLRKKGTPQDQGPRKPSGLLTGGASSTVYSGLLLLRAARHTG